MFLKRGEEVWYDFKKPIAAIFIRRSSDGKWCYEGKNIGWFNFRKLNSDIKGFCMVIGEYSFWFAYIKE